MITNKDTATQISALMLELGAKLDASVALVRDTCEEQEFNRYRRVVGELMGTMLLEVMNPLYQAYPELKPVGLR
jgi:hypothetical protein